jgi:hypothetical protein
VITLAAAPGPDILIAGSNDEMILEALEQFITGGMHGLELNDLDSDQIEKLASCVAISRLTSHLSPIHRRVAPKTKSRKSFISIVHPMYTLRIRASR